ncbi:hypothetical protein D1O30_07015 [Methylocystis hirsuta]|uniref:Uncharacterized protein n=1 Tax=Methylocystis hirsuta TaxID=369798 RepID=A0A3M9XM78_9HYPH|nr:hypothetical protein D1O30_07015 [Methylocystis hirsuta]
MIQRKHIAGVARAIAIGSAVALFIAGAGLSICVNDARAYWRFVCDRSQRVLEGIREWERQAKADEEWR